MMLKKIETFEPRHKKTCLLGFQPGPTQTLEMARGLQFRIWEVEGLYYLRSENKGADQLRGNYRAADLLLCFCIC